MKIAYLIAHLGQTGVNQVVVDLVVQMQGHGHECCVFYMEKVEHEMDIPCETVLLTDRDQLKGFDVIHAHGLKPEMWIVKKVWRHKREYQNTKFVTTLHCYCFQDFCDLYGSFKGGLMGGLYLLVKRPFDKVVCLSKDMRQYYTKWLPKRKLTYAYNTRNIDSKLYFVSDDEQEMLSSFKGNGTLIGMNCVLIYRKGIDVMLKAMALLPKTFKLIIMGEGQERSAFEQMSHELGIEQRVFFAGMQKDAFRFLPYYDIYAMPSRSEGFPLVLLEAAAYGTKVVASSLPVVKECFTDDEVITFDMPEAQALADTIIKANEKKDLGKRLKQRFEMDYAPTAFFNRYIDIYGE